MTSQVAEVGAGRTQLTIVIPALNEEEAIGGTIERCLAARAEICTTGVTSVRIVVVSDGSTDRTPQIASSYPEVDVVVFPKNRGYGAAIKAGWNRGGGELRRFLDADGTCDPRFFVPMCRQVLDHGQDVVLGCRMSAESQMPAVRRVGNVLFAILLGGLARRRVRQHGERHAGDPRASPAQAPAPPRRPTLHARHERPSPDGR